ncbi:MAG: adenylosuccinate lyase, partial [Bacilli bacterium]|nr:adenylosuccinate lyase [Bacilli bacterium]
QMKKNIKQTNNVIFSGRIVSMLIEKNLSREESYDLIQKIALKSYLENIDFLDLLLKSEIINYLTPAEIKSELNIDYYLRNINKIYQRLKLEEKNE